MDQSYETLVRDALRAPVAGWDFSLLAGRVQEDILTWDYLTWAAQTVSDADTLLDVDTGGGELLAELLAGLGCRRRVIATEPHTPNVPIARATLSPFGVDVRPGTASALPIPASSVDLVLNRHGGLDAAEVARVLAPGGVLLTQQVGSENDVAFNEALGVPPQVSAGTHTLETASAALDTAGLKVMIGREEFPESRYLDVGAVVYQLRVVSWQVPGFDVAALDEPLRAIDARIRKTGCFTVRSHRFLIRAEKPY